MTRPGRRRIPALPVGIALSLAVHAAGLAVLARLTPSTATDDTPAQLLVALGSPVIVRIAEEQEDDIELAVRASLDHTALDVTPSPAPLQPVEIPTTGSPSPPSIDPVTHTASLTWSSVHFIPMIRSEELADAPPPQEFPEQIADASDAAAPAPLPPVHSDVTLPEQAPPIGLERGAAVQSLPRPAYPPRAVRRGFEGTARVRVDISGDGEVLGVVIETSSGHEILDHAALDAARTGTYRPAQRSGEPARDSIIVPFEFRLTD